MRVVNQFRAPLLFGAERQSCFARQMPDGVLVLGPRGGLERLALGLALGLVCTVQYQDCGLMRRDNRRRGALCCVAVRAAGSGARLYLDEALVSAVEGEVEGVRIAPMREGCVAAF